MLEQTYRPMQNAHALKRLVTPQLAPSKKLAVGDDEVKDSQPVLVFTEAYANMHNRVMQDNRKRAIEFTGKTGDGNTLVQDDFLHDDFYLGDVIEVI